MPNKKLTKKKTKLRKCPRTKPEPPCKNGLIEKEKIYKNGDKSICCYKTKNTNNKNTNKNNTNNNINNNTNNKQYTLNINNSVDELIAYYKYFYDTKINKIYGLNNLDLFKEFINSFRLTKNLRLFINIYLIPLVCEELGLNNKEDYKFFSQLKNRNKNIVINSKNITNITNNFCILYMLCDYMINIDFQDNNIQYLPELFSYLHIRGDLILCDNNIKYLKQEFIENIKIEGDLDLTNNPEFNPDLHNLDDIDIGGQLYL